MAGDNIFQKQLAAGDGCHQHKAAGLDTVWNGGVAGRVQGFYAKNAHHISACAFNARAHCVQKISQVNNFRFLGCVFNHGGALSQRGCHHNIFRRANAGEIQINAGSVQMVHLSFNVARADGDASAHSLKAFQVQVNRPGANGAAAGQGNSGLAQAGQQGAHNQKGGAHFLHLLKRGGAVRQAGGVNLQGAVFKMSFGAQIVKYVAHIADVGQPRRFLNF